MKIIVLGDAETTLLFSLEGIDTRLIANASEAVDEIRRIRKSREYGLLIVTEDVAQWASEIVDELRFSKGLPLVIEIPGPNGAPKGASRLANYIREAVGIRI